VREPSPYYPAQVYRMQWKQDEGLAPLLEAVRRDETFGPAHVALGEITLSERITARPCGGMGCRKSRRRGEGCCYGAAKRLPLPPEIRRSSADSNSRARARAGRMDRIFPGMPLNCGLF
jgi:hypothetical protein